MAASSPFLEVSHIEAVYGETNLALRDVSLAVPSSGIVALLGANGSGKTTTLKAISNLLGPSRGNVRQGHIRWKGEEATRVDAADLVRRGIVQVLEGRHCFPQLTVEENLLSGGFLRGASRRALKSEIERIYEWFPRLRQKRTTRTGLTSGGEQQMVAIGRALMTQPELVLLDEPSMGLAPIIVQEIFEIIGNLNRSEGTAFLIAEQNLNLALRHASHGYVLETGRVVAEGSAADLLALDNVHDFYLGGSASTH